MGNELLNETDYEGFINQNIRFVKLINLYQWKLKELITKGIFIKRIGNTTYRVNVFFKESENETMEDKLLHLVNMDIEKIIPERNIYE